MDRDEVLKKVRDHITACGFELGAHEIAIAPYLTNHHNVTLRLTGKNGVYGYVKMNEYEGELKLYRDSADAIFAYLHERAIERCVVIESSPNLRLAAFKRASAIEKAMYQNCKTKHHGRASLSDTTQKRRAYVQAEIGPLRVESGKLTLSLSLPEHVADAVEKNCHKLGDLIEMDNCPQHLHDDVHNTSCFFTRQGDSFTTSLIRADHVLDDKGMELDWYGVEAAGKLVMNDTSYCMISDGWKRSSEILKELHTALTAVTAYDLTSADHLTLEQVATS